MGKKRIEDWEKELEPWVSKPDREEEEGIYQIKKTIVKEIWAKQKPIIHTFLTKIRQQIQQAEKRGYEKGIAITIKNFGKKWEV